MSTPSQPGLDGTQVTIDATDVVLPRKLDTHNVLLQVLTQSLGRSRLDVWLEGDGLPNVPDRYEWILEYGIDDTIAATCSFLEKLRTRGGVHPFADWKARTYTWTVRSGQQFMYLPRQDAFSLGYAGRTVQANYGATATRTSGGVTTALTVVYKASVASGDAVPNGEIWISNATVQHPDSNYVVAPFKVGTTLSLFDDITITFHPLFRTVITDVATQPFEVVGREDKTLYLAEVA